MVALMHKTTERTVVRGEFEASARDHAAPCALRGAPNADDSHRAKNLATQGVRAPHEVRLYHALEL